MALLTFKIITPERTVFTARAREVVLPTAQGEIAILPHHIPLISLLKAGAVRVINEEGIEEILAVSTGVIEVSGMNITVLADTAERADELEEEKIAHAREAAEKLMTERRTDSIGFAEATALLERELARMKVARLRRSRGGPRVTPEPRE